MGMGRTGERHLCSSSPREQLPKKARRRKFTAVSPSSKAAAPGLALLPHLAVVQHLLLCVSQCRALALVSPDLF